MCQTHSGTYNDVPGTFGDNAGSYRVVGSR
ncbi:LecA/PA-IL family lectin [Geminicoccus flavidas]